MKKILIAIATLMTVSSVSAELCTAKLEQQDRNRSYTIQTFVKYDYNQQRACNSALQDCRQEMSERRRYDRHANLTCTLEATRGGNQSKNCSFDIQNRNGRVIDTFSRLSCRAAEDACKRELIQRNRSGRNLRARCVQSYSRPTPPTRNVTRSCVVDRRGSQGRIKGSHSAQATGRQGSGVQAQACQKAMNKCQRSTVNRQYCTQR